MECGVCGGAGLVQATAEDLPDQATADVLMLAETAQHGLMWESGGLGNQARWQIECVRIAWQTMAHFESLAKKG